MKPGVRKKTSEMSPAEMRRKGSFAARFYGRKMLPPLHDEAGNPTRFALSAAAWGEPVPRTGKQAHAIAARGKRLLELGARASERGVEARTRARERGKVRAQQQ